VGAKLKVLFLCTGNSCRSQMAEGWARRLKGDRIEAYSAGVEPKGMDPLAVRVMREAGVDISGQRPKDLRQLPAARFDWVITLCGDAAERCPVLPGGARTAHAGFDDPPRLAAGARSEEEALRHYRRVRDEIREFVAGLPEGLDEAAAGAAAGQPVLP